MNMPTTMIGLHSKLVIVACQQIIRATISPIAATQHTSKTVTNTSEVMPLREAILEAIMFVMIPGARSSRSNQLIYLCKISSIIFMRRVKVSFSPIAPNIAR